MAVSLSALASCTVVEKCFDDTLLRRGWFAGGWALAMIDDVDEDCEG